MTATSSRRLPWVDALRGIAALVVLLHHVLVFYRDPLHRALGATTLKVLDAVGARHGEAVLAFFVLSGFSIRLSIESRGLSTRADLNHYLYRRFRRILPPYWLALALSAVAAAIVPVRDDSFGLDALLGNLVFLQSSARVPGNWIPPFAANGPLWSLSFEMSYYLTFPLFYRLVAGRVRRLLAAFAISVLAIGFNKLWPNPLAQFGGQFVVWYLGVELAELHLTKVSAAPSWCYAPLALALFGASTALGAQQLFALAEGVLFAQVGVAAMSVAARRTQSAHSESGSGPGRFVYLFAWVGGFSYALYLLHYPILRAAKTLLGPSSPLAIGGLVLVCMAVAFVAERLLTRSRHVYLERAYLGRDR